MNPAIHHPTWYKHIGVLSEEEAGRALKGQFMVARHQAQFGIENIQVFCDFERWQLHVEGKLSESVERAKNITSKVFDISLKHTTVNSVGLNFLHHFPVDGVINLGERLARLLTPAIGLPHFEGMGGTVALFTQVPEGHFSVKVEPSVIDESLLFVGFHLECTLPPASPAGSLMEIRIDELIDRTVPRLLPRMSSELLSICAAVKGGD